MSKTKFRTVYNSPHLRVQRSFISDDITDPYTMDLTKQHFAAQCDVNNIVKAHPDLDPNSFSDASVANLLSDPELYGEFDTGETFQSALDVVNRAREQFNTLPAELRKRFSYDPYEFLSYVNNPNNAEEMKKFGLLKEDIPVTNIPETGSQPVIQPVQPAETQPSSTVEPTP